MRKIFLKYNPYRLNTLVTIDGKLPKQNSKLNFGDKRLQEWIEELPQILVEECSTKEFELTFQGTLLDYEDVESMVKASKKHRINFKLKHIPAKEVIDKEKEITEIFYDILNGPFEELKQPDLEKAFEKAKSSDFEVNVVATMSAGKSTLINALLRQKLMPSKQEACTATITEIKDNKNYEREKFIAEVYDLNGKTIKLEPELTFKVMEELNSDDKVSKIKAEGNIPFVTSDDISLVLVDTPGPNNSRDPKHKAATYRMLSESSKTVVLYILNATQLAVDDDFNLLSHVAKSMSVGGKQSRDRFIFVVNKLDQFKKGEDSVDSAIVKVRDYLKDNGIENANIFPTSALTALDIRTILQNPNDYDEDDVDEVKLKVRKFNKNEEMYFEKKASLTPSMRCDIQNKLEEAKDKDDKYAEALIHTGIIPIEMAIQMYVQKYAKTAKIKSIVDTFSKKIESTHSFEMTKQEINENEEKRQEILDNINIIRNNLENGKEAQEFEKKIDEINYEAKIKADVYEIIGEAQARVTDHLTSSEDKIDINEAKIICDELAKFAENLQAEVQVKLEDLISNHVQKNIEDLLKQYKIRISKLTQDINTDDIVVDPFKIIEGDIYIEDIEALISETVQMRNIKVGEEWIRNTHKKWYKPWTWLKSSGYYKDIYEDKECINQTMLETKFLAPLQQQFYEYKEYTIKYAEIQTKAIKRIYYKKFSEINKILNDKLKELEECVENKEQVERKIKETQDKLTWLENIQERINSVLEI